MRNRAGSPVHDQPGLFDLPDPPIAATRQAGSGRTRETYARTVMAEVTIRDSPALRAEALRRLDEDVIEIGADVGAPDHPDTWDEVAGSPAAALQWCLEPTVGLGPLLESGAVRIVAIDVTVDEITDVLARARWTVTIKLRDAPATRELVLVACPFADVETRAEITSSFATLWNLAAGTPGRQCPRRAVRQLPPLHSWCPCEEAVSDLQDTIGVGTVEHQRRFDLQDVVVDSIRRHQDAVGA